MKHDTPEAQLAEMLAAADVSDHAWVRHVPTDVLENLAEWWRERLVIVTREDANGCDVPHARGCDGSTHEQPGGWTGAVCAELTRRKAAALLDEGGTDV